MGLLNRKLMSDKKAAKLADAMAQYESLAAANPGAIPEMREYAPAELEDLAAGAKTERKAQKDLHKHGVDAPAVLNSLRPTGTTGFSGAQELEFDVTIALASGGSHNAKVTQQMLPSQLEGIANGGPLTVKYDPDDPDNAILIGW
jgi:ABC-type transporter Mla subunit MlaD